MCRNVSIYQGCDPCGRCAPASGPNSGACSAFPAPGRLSIPWPALRACFLLCGCLFSACPQLCSPISARVLFRFWLALSAVFLLMPPFGRHVFSGDATPENELLPSCYQHPVAVPAFLLSTFEDISLHVSISISRFRGFSPSSSKPIRTFPSPKRGIFRRLIDHEFLKF